VIGARTGRDSCPAGGGLVSAAANELLNRRPVQPHVALCGVHRLGNTETVTEEVSPKRQCGVPVNARRRPGYVVAQRVHGHVRCGEHFAVSETARVLDPLPWRAKPDGSPGSLRCGQGDRISGGWCDHAE
jgi:hypothetical protein